MRRMTAATAAALAIIACMSASPAAAQKPTDAELTAAASARAGDPNRPAQWWPEISKKSEPRSARSFEPAAISGGESATVLELLMSIPEPSPAVVASIEAGVRWYRDSQINGLKLTYADGDRIVIPGPNAPPLWARFCEIGAGRPIFAGRDGVIRYSLADIEKERRGGYAWHNISGTQLFARYAEWKRSHGANAGQ